MNFLYFILCLIVGFLFIKFNKWITDNTDRIEFVEKYVPGGTYTFWQIAGVAGIIFGFWVLFH